MTWRQTSFNHVQSIKTNMAYVALKKTTWQESEKSKYKEDQPVRKGRKDAKHCVFPNPVPEGRKVGLLKRRVWSYLVE